ncbi:TetR/AcrR family transcriptional regulator [Saccharopolyspora sp. NPDC002376]
MLDLTDLAPVSAPRTTRVGGRLLAAASELFYNRGITAVGVDMLAEHAGTTKRTLYQRFGSKDGLIAAYLQQRAHTWQTTLLTGLNDAAPSTPHDGLTVVFSTAEQWAHSNPRGCAFVNAWAELNSIQSSGVEIIAAEKRWMLELFGRVLDRSDVAAQVHLIYEGAHVTASILGDRDAYKCAEMTSRCLLDRTIDKSNTCNHSSA